MKPHAMSAATFSTLSRDLPGRIWVLPISLRRLGLGSLVICWHKGGDQ